MFQREMRHGWQDDGEIKVESQYHAGGRDLEPLEHNLIILMEISMGSGELLQVRLSDITDLSLFLNTHRNSLVKASTTTDRVQQFNCPSDHEEAGPTHPFISMTQGKFTLQAGPCVLGENT